MKMNCVLLAYHFAELILLGCDPQAPACSPFPAVCLLFTKADQVFAPVDNRELKSPALCGLVQTTRPVRRDADRVHGMCDMHEKSMTVADPVDGRIGFSGLGTTGPRWEP